MIVDNERVPYIVKMFEMSAAGKSGRYIRQWLEDNNVRTRGDKDIPLSMIYRMLGSHFYYGEFEYPKGSGQWYKGKHKPLINKELFEKVREQAKVPIKPKWGAKEFPFKRFLSCYSCGAGVVGEEKIRHYKNGNSPRFVYYHCSRQVDRSCNEPFVREQVIVDELVTKSRDLITDISVLEPGLRDAIRKFHRMISVAHGPVSEVGALDGYIKYVLQEGSVFEKTRLVRNISSDIKLSNRQIIICR